MSLALIVGAALPACSGSADRAASVHADDATSKAASVYSAETFYETISHAGASFSADAERVLFTNDSTGIFNVYSMPVGGGKVTPLTQSSSKATFLVDAFPKDDRVLVTADGEGNEIRHLYVRSPDGSMRDLVDAPEARVGFMGFSADDQSMFVRSSERDPKFADLYRYNLADLSRELILQNPGGFEIVDVSRDGRYVALLQFVTNADSNIFVYDTQSKAAPRLITPHEGAIDHSPLSFGPDGKTLYYASNAGSEFNRAWAIDLISGQSRLAIDSQWDLQSLHFSHSGRYMAYRVNEAAQSKLTIIDTQTNAPLKLPEFAGMNVLNVMFSRDDTRASMYIGSDVSPPDLYTMQLDATGTAGAPVRLTHSLTPKIDPEHLVAAEHIHYPSFDGLEIPALLYRAAQATAQKPGPAIVLVHGGPGGQSRHGYRADVQHLVNQGYTVLAVNNRGSSGYGKTFYHMDDRKHGTVDLDDCVWGHKFLAAQDWVRDDAIAIMGGSYGGYMTAAALAFRPEVFAAGIDIFGVTNWERTLASIPEWWESYRIALYTEMGDPATDGQRHHEISPLFYPQNFKRPLLVVQGANDPRVLKVESDELVAAVKKQGVPVTYLVFPDEGHGFAKKANRIAASKAFIAFLQEHVPVQAPAKTGNPES